MKKLLVFVGILFMLSTTIYATDVFFSANDLEPITLSEKTNYDGFTINATTDKPIAIQEMDEREAEDGEIFNNRIKLGGSGNKDKLSITFKLKKGDKVTVYLNSTSKTDERVLNVMSSSSNDVLFSLPAPPATSLMEAGIASFSANEDGTYTICSAKSGIYIYAIKIE